MESSQRGALGLVRFIAVCIIAVGLLDAGLYFTEYLGLLSSTTHHEPRQPFNVLRVVLDSLPVIAGIVILIKAKTLAEWVADLIE